MHDLHFYDPRGGHAVLERRLPHWSQAGVVCFITWRTSDSIPADVLHRWKDERFQWLRDHQINPRSADWRVQLMTLSRKERDEFQRSFSDRWHHHLDAGHGACVLQDVQVAQIVADSLRKFDEVQYDLTDFVIMPNHVHLLAAFFDEQTMLAQCENWKHYQAGQINRMIGGSGRFWQQDGFDHLVRSAEQFEHFRNYIRDNPKKARLKACSALAWSKPLKM